MEIPEEVRLEMKQLEDTTARIQDWVTTTFPLARKQNIGVDDSLLDSGIIDSMGTLEIVQFLEDDFSIVVEDEEMVADHFESIASIARFVESKSSRGNVEAN